MLVGWLIDFSVYQSLLKLFFYAIIWFQVYNNNNHLELQVRILDTDNLHSYMVSSFPYTNTLHNKLVGFFV